MVDKIHHEMQGNAQRDSMAAQSAELEIVSTGAEGVYTGDILLQTGQIGREKLEIGRASCRERVLLIV